MAKYIFVAGGVMSGIGKGVATSSIGAILQARGYSVTAIKIDPYINVDAGTMNPIEHGEVFVTDDGVECDQDIGNYERFLDRNIYSANYMTTGRVYQAVINRERNLGYNGKCVEVVPDIPEEVIRRIKRVAVESKADFVLIEIGGTVGEYQNMLFLEAARMMRLRRAKDVLFALVTYLPIPKMVGEMKTKPTQYAVRTLNSAGIQPDIILARSEVSIDKPRKRKISIACNIAEDDVISAPDIESIYEVPLNFEKENLGKRIINKFELRAKKACDLSAWEDLVKSIKNPERPVKIGIVGKYFETGDFVLPDSYLSVIEAVKHAAWSQKRKPEISWLNSDHYEKFPESIVELKGYDGIIVPGGFGSRGVEGKILAAEYCRRNNIPYLGLCYGMQIATIEFARNVCNLKGAHTSEIDKKAPYMVIDVMPDQKVNVMKKDFGATMRLGAYPCNLLKGSKAFAAYKNSNFEQEALESGDVLISERHRHRYELNNEYRKTLEDKGLVMSGINPDRDLVEIIELPKHKFYLGTQFHPEFKSRPLRPHPLFLAFVKACLP
jgi:CTP synthase